MSTEEKSEHAKKQDEVLFILAGLSVYDAKRIIDNVLTQLDVVAFVRQASS